MRVLSIDPGYERLGIAVIEKGVGQKERLLYSTCFQTPKIEGSLRLKMLGDKIKEVIEEYVPTHLAIEDLFLASNQKTAMFVSEAKGVTLYIAATYNLTISHFSPPQIKLAVCGDGKADKKAIIKMIPLLIKIEKEIAFDDEYDAIAVGLTFFAFFKEPLS